MLIGTVPPILDAFGGPFQLFDRRKAVRLLGVQLRCRRKKVPEMVVRPVLERKAVVDVVSVVQAFPGPDAIQGFSRFSESRRQIADFPRRVLNIGPGASR